MEIADGPAEHFNGLVLASGILSPPLPSIRLLSTSGYRGCVESFKIAASLCVILLNTLTTNTHNLSPFLDYFI